MALRGFIITQLLVCVFLSFCFNSNGLEETNNTAEDLEIDRLLELLNKPHVKSIQTQEGDIFDCVDIYKQPAFDNPLLQNHTIQLQPSSFPEGILKNASSSSSANSSTARLREGCPSGTVPIKRTRKEDLIWSKLFNKNPIPTFTRSNVPPLIGSGAYHWAAKVIPATGFNAYFGASATLNIQNPPSLQGYQFSQSLIRIQSVPGAEIDNIQVGWMVNQNLFGDLRTRTFGLWRAGDRGCFNTLCPGFVQISKDFTLGFVLNDVSVFGKEQYGHKWTIFKDKQTGNWWLLSDEIRESVGYWPKSLFTSLSDSASELSWGGLVYSTDSEVNPTMGTGHFPSEGYSKAAYIKDIQVIDQENRMLIPDNSLLQDFVDSPKCYQVGPLQGVPNGFLFGGPGGTCD